MASGCQHPYSDGTFLVLGTSARWPYSRRCQKQRRVFGKDLGGNSHYLSQRLAWWAERNGQRHPSGRRYRDEHLPHTSVESYRCASLLGENASTILRYLCPLCFKGNYAFTVERQLVVLSSYIFTERPICGLGGGVLLPPYWELEESGRMYSVLRHMSSSAALA
jgi:hypothetical protein